MRDGKAAESEATLRADPDAPEVLVGLTTAVRQIVSAHNDGEVSGECVHACMALGRAVLRRGLQATMQSVSAGSHFHWCIRSGPWVLDPTSGQWGEEPVIVFRAGSPDDWYGPGRQGTTDLSDDDDIVFRYANWLVPEYADALLVAAGSERLIDAVDAERERLAAERLAEFE